MIIQIKIFMSAYLFSCIKSKEEYNLSVYYGVLAVHFWGIPVVCPKLLNQQFVQKREAELFKQTEG